MRFSGAPCSVVVACFCSAGIGRTGVLITMETAMCLIEANQPVYPLNIVRQMREQRAMLIQTSVRCAVTFSDMCSTSLVFCLFRQIRGCRFSGISGNLGMSGNSAKVGENSGKRHKVREKSGSLCSQGF